MLTVWVVKWYLARKRFHCSAIGSTWHSYLIELKVEAKEQGRTNPGDKFAVAPHICVGPQFGTSLKSPFWRPEFWGCSQIFGKFVHHCQIGHTSQGTQVKISLGFLRIWSCHYCPYTLQASDMWRRVFWWTGTDIWEKPTCSHVQGRVPEN
jgi:hypothetical protein